MSVFSQRITVCMFQFCKISHHTYKEHAEMPNVLVFLAKAWLQKWPEQQMDGIAVAVRKQ